MDQTRKTIRKLYENARRIVFSVGWLSPSGEWIEAGAGHEEEAAHILSPEDRKYARKKFKKFGALYTAYLLALGYVRVTGTGLEIDKWDRKTQKLVQDFITDNGGLDSPDSEFHLEIIGNDSMSSYVTAAQLIDAPESVQFRK